MIKRVMISQLYTQYTPKRISSVLHYIQKEHCYCYTRSKKETLYPKKNTSVFKS